MGLGWYMNLRTFAFLIAVEEMLATRALARAGLGGLVWAAVGRVLGLGRLGGSRWAEVEGGNWVRSCRRAQLWAVGKVGKGRGLEWRRRAGGLGWAWAGTGGRMALLATG